MLSLFPAGPAGREFALKSLSRFFLLAGIFLLAATSLPAQRFVSGGGAYSYGYGGYGGYGYSGYGWGGGVPEIGGWGFGISGLHRPEEHAPFGVGFAHGDPEFVPSTYMEYEQALELGKKILAEQAKPQPSLGEIARELRARKRNYVPPPAPGSTAAPSRSEATAAVWDTRNHPVLCRVSAATCKNAA